MAGKEPRKTPLDAALAAFTNAESREDVLKLVHAVLSTAMVASALAPDDKTLAKKAAKAECYAEAILLVEEHLGGIGCTSAFIPKKQTVYTTPQPGVVRARPQTP